MTEPPGGASAPPWEPPASRGPIGAESPADVVTSTMAGLFGRDGLYLLLWLAGVVVAAAATPVATRLLGPAAFGTVAAAISVMQVLFVLGGLGLQVSVQRVFEDRGPDAARRLITVAVVGAVVVAVVADVTGPLWSPALGFGAYGGAVRLAVAWAGASAVTATLMALLRSQDRLLGFGAVSLLQSIGVEVAALLTAALWTPTAEAFVLGRLGAQVVAVALGLALARPGRIRTRDRTLTLGALAFGLPLVPAMLGSFVLGAADRLLVQDELGEVAVGRYQVAYNIGSLPLLVLGVLNSVWLPRFFAVGSNADGDAVATGSRDALYRLLAPVLVGLSVGSPLILRLWAPPEFRVDDLLLLAAVVIVSAVPYAAGLSATRVLLAAGRPGWVAGAAVVASVVNVGLNLWWLPVFGLLGAALATVVAYGLQHLLLLLPTRGRPFGHTRAGPTQVGAAALLALGAVALPTGTGGLVLRGVLAAGCLAWFGRAWFGLAYTAARFPGGGAVAGAAA